MTVLRLTTGLSPALQARVVRRVEVTLTAPGRDNLRTLARQARRFVEEIEGDPAAVVVQGVDGFLALMCTFADLADALVDGDRGLFLDKEADGADRPSGRRS